MQDTAGRLLGRAWAKFRSWPLIVQVIVGLLVLGIPGAFSGETEPTSAAPGVTSDSSPTQGLQASDSQQDSNDSGSNALEDQETSKGESDAASKPVGEPKFNATGVTWEALSLAQLKVMFTITNEGSASGHPECFVEVDATDLLDECWGECGAQDILAGAKLQPGRKIQTFGMINVEGGAAPEVYDVDVLC